MADINHRHAANVEGPFYVDTSCIDCDTCRWMAPQTFHDIGDQSVVHVQPRDEDERLAAAQALLACPTASIGMHADAGLVRRAQASFPIPVADNVSFCGYTSKHSFGAASYLVIRPEGNVLVDSPRFAAPLVKKLEELGGVQWMFLTHRDDVADHARFAAHFKCTRVMHADDVTQGTREVEMKLEGQQPAALAPDLLVIPTPGHTRGSAVLLHRKFLFTGDHLAWSAGRGHLYAFRTAMWYRWDVQIESMKRLREFEFEWVLPGHGRRHHADARAMRQSLEQCISWMEQS